MVDFHHIALDGMTVENFDQIAAHQPDYARYVYWFWQEQSINAGHPMALRKIKDRFKKYGWIK
jgi:phage/plasmid-associated DNA primase